MAIFKKKDGGNKAKSKETKPLAKSKAVVQPKPVVKSKPVVKAKPVSKAKPKVKPTYDQQRRAEEMVAKDRYNKMSTFQKTKSGVKDMYRKANLPFPTFGAFD